MIKFVPNTLGYKVRGPNGDFYNFAGVAHMADEPIWELEFTNKTRLRCSGAHKVFGVDKTIPTNKLVVGDKILTRNGRTTKVKSITETQEVKAVYDLIEVEGDHAYETNSVISKNCEFVTDDETLINPLTLSYMTFQQPKFYIEEARYYHDPEPNKTYIVCLDPGLGTQNDAAAIQIFMLPDMLQIGEWQTNKANPREQMRTMLVNLWFLDDELRNHPDQDGDPQIYWTVENNSMGEANLQLIEDIGEQNFPGTLVNEKRKKGSSKRFRKGLNTNTSNKRSSCAQLKNLVEGNRIKINSENLVTELKNYVRAGDSFKAKAGMHDDLVSAMLLSIRVATILRAQGIEVGESLNNAFSNEEIFGEPTPFVL
jgi:hypothetical protein